MRGKDREICGELFNPTVAMSPLNITEFPKELQTIRLLGYLPLRTVKEISTNKMKVRQLCCYMLLT